MRIPGDCSYLGAAIALSHFSNLRRYCRSDSQRRNHLFCTRSHTIDSVLNNANRVEELMQRGLMAQGMIATFAILMFSFIGIYGIYRYIGQQVQQIQDTYSNVR
ncbi:hypothetical protein [Nostoc flagelliforme]|nr:hypothetical protein [Nostoc flagelliforme]